ncbi:hypothetical protein EP43_14080 [Listeria monocytogenes]|uniref:hypothetical protein n=1 Tax=Listeria monocytogenes TaxID=1639 RepID=UPI0010E0ECB7|nr:hypothetical protein [Listeria monocytogenes]EAE1303637.1 hypothetical protein [Listeria monocytogenes]EAG2315616.1 hypothetical protein [Listeria monocytogenes]
MLKEAIQQQEDDLPNQMVAGKKSVGFSNIKTVDVAEVDLCTPGTYQALYQVMGLDGSTTTKGVMITVE